MDLDGFYSPLNGQKIWQTPSLGEVSWHCHVAPTRFQSGELHKCHHCHHARTQRCMHPLSSPSLTLPPCVKNKMFEEQKHVLFSLSLVNWASFLKISPMNFHILNYFLPQWWFGSRNALPRFVAFSLS